MNLPSDPHAATRFSLAEWWAALTRPHDSITTYQARRHAQVLAAMSLLFGVAVVASIPVVLFITGTTLPYQWLVLLMLAAAYTASRSRWPQFGAWLVTYGQMAVGVMLVFSLPNPAVIPQAFMLLLVPLLFSMLLLTAWYTVGLAALTVLSVLAIVLLTPSLDVMQLTLPLAVVVALSGLGAAAAFIRERDIRVIAEQSEEVARTSRRLEREVARISATAEVGRAITAMRSQDDLLGRVVELIVSRFGYYHAQVFLVDESGRYAVLRQSTGEAGRKLLERGHRLAVGSQSVIGQVVARVEPVLAADTDVAAVHRRNELLPNTRAELALPLRVGGRVIGALDIQSEEPGAFEEADVAVFQTMADQLAIAIENARLFERARSDLQDIERLNRQLTGDAWRDYMKGRAENAALGYRADGRQVVPVGGETPTSDAFTLPLQVRGETVGMLDVSPRPGAAPPDEETRRLIEAVAERVALALDSTRLGEQARQQALREQVLSRLSAELQATTDLDVMLNLAVTEASRALGAPHGFIHLTMEYGPERA